ncbi:hypothetical protein TNCV_1642871 [Trichonephila clavipes]|nr:hypothetical protein TNCV_1642871 [Trichonephila clavipes]
MLLCVHEDEALSMKCVYKGFAHFRECRESVFDKTRSEKPVTSISDENIKKVKKLTERMPRHLTDDHDDQKQAHLEASQDFVETANATPNFLNSIVTQKESGVSGKSLKRYGKAWNGVFLHHLDKIISEQKRYASKRCSSSFLVVNVLSTLNFNLRNHG